MCPTAILIFGPPGSGKSYVASSLAATCSLVRHISNDEIRRQLALPLIGRKFTARVYQQAALMAEQTVADGLVPVLDSTYYLRAYRKPVFEILSSFATHWILCILQTPIDVCRRRVTARRLAGDSRIGGSSDERRFDILVSRTEPIDISEMPGQWSHIVIDGSGPKPLLSEWTNTTPPGILEAFERFCRTQI